MEGEEGVPVYPAGNFTSFPTSFRPRKYAIFVSEVEGEGDQWVFVAFAGPVWWMRQGRRFIDVFDSEVLEEVGRMESMLMLIVRLRFTRQGDATRRGYARDRSEGLCYNEDVLHRGSIGEAGEYESVS